MQIKKTAERIFNFLKIYNVDLPKTRIGSRGDDGYVIVDQIPCEVLLSAGLSDNVDFETEFCERHKVNCLGFDGTISKLPKESKIAFVKKKYFFQEFARN